MDSDYHFLRHELLSVYEVSEQVPFPMLSRVGGRRRDTPRLVFLDPGSRHRVAAA